MDIIPFIIGCLLGLFILILLNFIFSEDKEEVPDFYFIYETARDAERKQRLINSFYSDRIDSFTYSWKARAEVQRQENLSLQVTDTHKKVAKILNLMQNGNISCSNCGCDPFYNSHKKRS